MNEKNEKLGEMESAEEKLYGQSPLPPIPLPAPEPMEVKLNVVSRACAVRPSRNSSRSPIQTTMWGGVLDQSGTLVNLISLRAARNSLIKP